MVDHGGLAELVQLAKAADLAILGQYPGDNSDGATWLRPDDLMIDIGRPVLVIPYAGAFASVGKRVLVAWDGTREANRALHDALPLIGGAEAVTVMHVGCHSRSRSRPAVARAHRPPPGAARNQGAAEESPRGGIAIPTSCCRAPPISAPT